MHMKDEERKRWFQWEHKQTPSSIWEWQEPDFLQERPDTDHIWYTLRKQKFLLWNINKILLNLTYILRNQKQKEISISGNIESVTHIEQLSHTWYKDFRKYVKKYFLKGVKPSTHRFVGKKRFQEQTWRWERYFEMHIRTIRIWIEALHQKNIWEDIKNRRIGQELFSRIL